MSAIVTPFKWSSIGFSLPPKPGMTNVVSGRVDFVNRIVTRVLGVDTPTAIGSCLPARTMLEQNAPNPFKPSTRVRFSLACGSHVDLAIEHVSGPRLRQGFFGRLPVYDGSSPGSEPLVLGGARPLAQRTLRRLTLWSPLPYHLRRFTGRRLAGSSA